MNAKKDDENSVAAEDPAYVGTSPEYQNHADVSQQPMLSEDDDARKLEERAAEVAEELARRVNPTNPRLSYDPGTVHPSEKTKPQDRYIEGNRALMDKAIADAQPAKKSESKSSPLGS